MPLNNPDIIIINDITVISILLPLNRYCIKASVASIPHITCNSDIDILYLFNIIFIPFHLSNNINTTINLPYITIYFNSIC